ncbi:MAG: OB-fold nucleic acid binding domain-containing protein, partial [Saprospiraceae bacterium]
IRVACIVAEAKHRISKKGTGFGTFVLQDYESTLEINLFGEDYQKFKHLFEVGQTLLIQGVYQMGWRGEDYELKISEVNQLASVTEKLASSMTIKFPLELLNPTFIGKFENICKKYKGKYPVKIMLIDTKNTTTLQFSNKNVRLKINNEILQALEQLGNVAVNIQ